MTTLSIDSEDFGGILFEMEDSFQIKFDYEKFENKITIEEICNMVISRLQLEQGNECSNQIVYFRIRRLISERLNIEKSSLNPETKLHEIFPFKNRRKKWNAIFDQFDFKVPQLGPPMGIFLLTVLTAFISFFFTFGRNWNYGIPIFSTSILIIFLLNRYGKSFPSEDLKGLTKRIVEIDYKNTRSKYGTYNVTELKKIILDMFKPYASFDEKDGLTLKAKIDYS